MPFQPFQAPTNWEGPGANPATPAFGTNGKPFLGFPTINVLQEFFGNSTTQKWIEFNMPLAIAPTLGETWSVDAINLGIVLRYFCIARYLWKKQFERFTKRITELEKRKTALESARTSAEELVTFREGKAETAPTYEARIARENIKAEIAAVLAEIVEVEKQREEFGVASVLESLAQSPFTIVAELYHSTELIWTETLEMKRTPIGTASWITVEAETKATGSFYEFVEKRVSLPISVKLLPGQTMSLRLRIYGPFPPLVAEEQKRFEEISNAIDGTGLFGFTFMPGINYEQEGA